MKQLSSKIITLFLLAYGIMSCTPAEKPGPEIIPEFDIKIKTEQNSNSIEVTVTPSIEDKLYYCAIIEAESFVSPEEQIVKDYNYFSEAALEKDIPINDLISSICVTGQSIRQFDDLKSNTDYVIYSYFITDDSFKENAFRSVPHETGLVETITIKLKECSGSFITAGIYPSDENCLYYTDSMKKEKFEELGGNEEGVRKYFDMLLDEYCSNMELSAEEAVASISRKGVSIVSYPELTPNSDYIIWALEIDNAGKAISKASIYETNSGNNIDSELILHFEILETTPVSVKIAVTPSNNQEQYFFATATKEQYEQYGSDKEYMNAILDYFGPYLPISQGYAEAEIQQLEPDTDHYVVGFGYNGYYSTELFKTEFRTTSTDDPSDIHFEISPEVVNQFNMTIKFIPSNSYTYYHANLIEKDLFDEYGGDQNAIVRHYSETIDKLTEMYPQYTRDEILEIWSYIGNMSIYFKSLKPETEYIVWAAAIDQKGSVTSEATTSVVKTETRIISAASVEIEKDGIYNGDELAEIDNTYIAEKGRAVAFFNIIPDNISTAWYSGIFNGKLGDETTDEELILKLEQIGYASKDRMICGISWDTEYTVCTVALDSDGNFGKVTRKYIKVSPEDADPIESYQKTSRTNNIITPAEPVIL